MISPIVGLFALSVLDFTVMSFKDFQRKNVTAIPPLVWWSALLPFITNENYIRCFKSYLTDNMFLSLAPSLSPLSLSLSLPPFPLSLSLSLSLPLSLPPSLPPSPLSLPLVLFVCFILFCFVALFWRCPNLFSVHVDTIFFIRIHCSHSRHLLSCSWTRNSPNYGIFCITMGG